MKENRKNKLKKKHAKAIRAFHFYKIIAQTQNKIKLKEKFETNAWLETLFVALFMSC